MSTTDRSTVTGGHRSSQGYWQLAPGSGERHLVRGDLVRGELAAPGTTGARADLGEPLLTVGHLSDLHVCDSQSPARAEFLDRWADLDSPLRPRLAELNGSGEVGAYRAQDCLTAQVVEAAVRAMNAVARGPVGGAAIDWALVTGDVTDNAQANELAWYLALLDGGRVVPDSGSLARYEGVADHEHWDDAFWHPDTPPTAQDRPHRLHGFPDAPGLLDALRQPFEATGLAMPWLAVHGNHDQMIQGTIPASGAFAHLSTSGAKAIGVPADWSSDAVLDYLVAFGSCAPAGPAGWSAMTTRQVTADRGRAGISRAEFIAAHESADARPPRHGFAADAGTRAYYRHDHGQVTLLTLDTVNEHGGWQGSLDGEQLSWLEAQLHDADRERRYVVLASHHPLKDLVNPMTPTRAGRAATGAREHGADRRALREEVGAVLAGHPSLVLWLNGHTHDTTVTAHDATSPWWEVTTPSLIDFPQQGRIVEVLRSASGRLTIATTMVDHAGELPWSGEVASVAAMAGLSRELAANDWQRATDDLGKHRAAGTPGDRNALLLLPDPFAD